MGILYIIILLVGIALSTYNWLYLHEIKAAKSRVGLTLPKNASLFLKGVCYMSLLSCSIILLAIFIHIGNAR